MSQTLNKSSARSYGREILQINFRRHGYRVTEDHVRAVIKLHDAEGSKTRKPGIKRKRRLNV
jgi:hypothetical protein